MFGNLFNNAINTVKSFLSGNKAAPKPAPKPAPPKSIVIPPKIALRPATTFQQFSPIASYSPYIAKWGDSKATIAAGQAQNNAANAAYLEQQKRQQEEQARAEAARRKWEAQQKFDKVKNEFAGKVAAQAKKNEDTQKGNFWSWATGGFAGENANRDFAQKRLEDLQKNQTTRYDNKLNDFLKQQAAKKAEIEKTKFKSQAEFDAALGIFTKWETEQIDNLEYARAANTGMSEAWSKESQREGKSGIAKIGGWFQKSVVQPVAANPIFKYTLGSGDENTPSLVTAPSRAVNFIGNKFNEGGNKNLSNDTWVKGYEKNKNAWTQTYNQRNFNMELPKQYNDADFEKWFAKTDFRTQSKQDLASGKLKESDLKEQYRKFYKAQLKNDAQFNTVAEFVADPLGLIPGEKIASGITKGSAWASKTIKATEKGVSLFEKASSIAQSKPIKWLGAEYKSPEAKFAEAYADAKKGTDALQERLAPRIQAINARLSKADQVDTSILDDFAKLSDNEAAILQRMVNGKFSTKDRLHLMDVKGLQYAAPQREKLLDLAARWDTFSEKMKIADNVSSSRYGKGNRFYSPRINYAKDNALETYNFRAEKKIPTHKNPQTAADLSRNARERYILSDSGVVDANNINKERSKWSRRRSTLQNEYKSKSDALRAPVRAADKQRGTMKRYIRERRAGVAPTTNFGRSLFNSSRKVVGTPTRVWKKSVLAYRPAWTVNNVGYNVQASALAGGVPALVESARMLRPKNFKKAMSEVPESVKADLTGELGAAYRGRNPFKKFDSSLNNKYSSIENFSRVAAFRGAKAKGLTDEQALKRVNKYMFDYKTKNWERPLKSVMPFWGWSKNLTKASVQMPFDRPFAAKGYNEVDQYQNNQFDAEFNKTIPDLQKLGYSSDEIEAMRKQQAQYYKGKLKIGDKWMNTPMNAFSERGLAGVGFNPYLTAVGESSTSTDSFGRKIGGTDSLLKNRVLSKFPQIELGKKGLAAWRVANRVDKPRAGWIGEAGSEGYGLSKERQGYDAKAANYDRTLDPRAKLGQDALAFVGVPRSTEFDKAKLIESKRLQKATSAYFALDTKGMQYDQAEKARSDVFKKYGITADQFYKGVLSKYDTENTKRIKGLKESAAADNKKLFDEYAAQPKGSRNVWATNKLRELNDRNYFADNPFKKSFDYITPTTVAKANKQQIVQKAIASGDWSAYRAKYGSSTKVKTRSAKAQARDRAVASGDWSKYAADYGVSTKKTDYSYDGKYFKSSDSMAKYKEGQFWQKYAAASKTERLALLDSNPQYNRRKNWTADMWQRDKTTKKAALVAKTRTWGDFAKTQDRIKATSTVSADRFNRSRTKSRLVTRWG